MIYSVKNRLFWQQSLAARLNRQPAADAGHQYILTYVNCALRRRLKYSSFLVTYYVMGWWESNILKMYFRLNVKILNTFEEVFLVLVQSIQIQVQNTTHAFKIVLKILVI